MKNLKENPIPASLESATNRFHFFTGKERDQAAGTGVFFHMNRHFCSLLEHQKIEKPEKEQRR